MYGISGVLAAESVLDCMPRDVVYRSKNSFTMPHRARVRRDLRNMIEEYILSPPGLSGRPYFNALCRQLIAAERAGRADNAQRIWHLLTLEQWFRNHRV